MKRAMSLSKVECGNWLIRICHCQARLQPPRPNFRPQPRLPICLMISLRRRVNLICRALALLVVLFLAGTIRAQNVVLHLRNGDRIAGTILSENTNTVTLSTVWIKELAVPVSQIERREILPPPPLAAATNIVIATNAVVTAGTTNLAAVKPSTVALTTNAPPAPWFKRWKGEAAVGMDMERGAT